VPLAEVGRFHLATYLDMERTVHKGVEDHMDSLALGTPTAAEAAVRIRKLP